MKFLSPMNDEEIAGVLYETYCKNVGGKAFNGDPLPDWKSFRADPNKKVQSDAWIHVATMAQVLAGNEFDKRNTL